MAQNLSGTYSCSSRSKRKFKPRNFGDDFYVHGSLARAEFNDSEVCGDIQSKTKMKKVKKFMASTPILKNKSSRKISSSVVVLSQGQQDDFILSDSSLNISGKESQQQFSFDGASDVSAEMPQSHLDTTLKSSQKTVVNDNEEEGNAKELSLSGAGDKNNVVSGKKRSFDNSGSKIRKKINIEFLSESDISGPNSEGYTPFVTEKEHSLIQFQDTLNSSGCLNSSDSFIQSATNKKHSCSKQNKKMTKLSSLSRTNENGNSALPDVIFNSKIKNDLINQDTELVESEGSNSLNNYSFTPEATLSSKRGRGRPPKLKNGPLLTHGDISGSKDMGSTPNFIRKKEKSMNNSGILIKSDSGPITFPKLKQKRTLKKSASFSDAWKNRHLVQAEVVLQSESKDSLNYSDNDSICRLKDLNNDGDDSSVLKPETVTPLKRGRGRPPKHKDKQLLLNQAKKEAKQILNNSNDDLINRQEGLNSDGGDTSILKPETVFPLKRGRGRPPNLKKNETFKTSEVEKAQEAANTLVGSSSINLKRKWKPRILDITTPPVKKKFQKHFDPKVHNLVENSNDTSREERQGNLLTCVHCGKTFKERAVIQFHMMSAHSLMWSPECQEGYENPYEIVKKIGYIDCPQCKKRLKTCHYYKHHRAWCGRENELENCPICDHTIKSMWMLHHINNHKFQDRKKVEITKSRIESNDQKVTDDSSGGGKSKRKAAKTALKMLSSFQVHSEQEASDDSEGYKDNGSSDDNTDSPGDDRTDENKKGTKSKGPSYKKQQTPNIKKSDKEVASADRSEYSGSVINSWISACPIGLINSKQNRQSAILKLYSKVKKKTSTFSWLCPNIHEWRSLDESEKDKYLPVNKISPNFGFGSTAKFQDKLEKHTLKFGQNFTEQGKAYCYTGGPIWALEWCPVPEEVSNYEQILAIVADGGPEEAPDTSRQTEGPALVQIWGAGSLSNNKSSSVQPKLHYTLAHDSGFVRSISWCPHNCFDLNEVSEGFYKRLGLLAVACSDGRVLVFSLPQPQELKLNGQTDSTVSVFKPKPVLVLVPNSLKGCGPCLCVTWQNVGQCKYILAGYGCGSVFLWDVISASPLLRVNSCTLRPVRSYLAHSAAVVSCAWNPRDPFVFITSALDFHMYVWHLDAPDQPIGSTRRQNYTMHCIHRAVQWAGPLHNLYFSVTDKCAGYDDYAVFMHGLSKAVLLGNMLTVWISRLRSCTWDVSFCPFNEVLAACDTLGTVRLLMLPMEVLRFRGAGKSSYHRSKIKNIDLYQAMLMSAPVSPTEFQSVRMNEEASKDCRTKTKQATNLTQESTSLIQESTCLTQESINLTQESINLTQESTSLTLPTTILTQPATNLTQPATNLTQVSSMIQKSTSSIQPTTSLTKSTTSVTQPKATLVQPTSLTQSTTRLIQHPTSLNQEPTSLTQPTINLTQPMISLTQPDTSVTQQSTSLTQQAINLSQKSLDCDLHTNSGQENIQKDLNIGRLQSSSDQVLYFNNCEKTIAAENFLAKAKMKIEFEDFNGSNLRAIHRVRLNPNPRSYQWLASGGQSGILRLDNLTSVIM